MTRGRVTLADHLSGDKAAALGTLILAAGAHAGCLLVASGLGVSGRRRRTRLWLLQAANAAAGPNAGWKDVEFLAALALIEALEIITEGPESPPALVVGDAGRA